MTWPFEEQSPSEGDGLTALAGALLFGDTLIVGAGRMVAAKVATLTGKCGRLTIIEKNAAIAVRGREEHSPWTGKDVVYGIFDVLDWLAEAKETHRFNSIFYDTWPLDENLYKAADHLAKIAAPAARLVLLGDSWKGRSPEGWTWMQHVNTGQSGNGGLVSIWRNDWQPSTEDRG